MAAVTPEEDRVRLLYRMRACRPLWRMVQQTGLEPAGAWWRGLDGMIARSVERCRACRHVDACGAWLDRAAPGEPPPSFCPNGRALEAGRIAASRTSAVSDGRGCETEPDLRALLDEPIVRQLMAADRVNPEILRHALAAQAPHIATYAAPQLPRLRRSRTPAS